MIKLKFDSRSPFLPEFIMHSTDPCVTDIPRITIAFDLITEKVYNMIDNKNFRELNK